MTRVLLVGSGAREHAIAEAFVRSGVEVHAHMERMNPGIAKAAKIVSVGSITDFRQLPDLYGLDYAVIGPEASLDAGISDYVEDENLPCVAPRRESAMIETSKSWARDMIQRSTPRANPQYKVVRSWEDYRKFLKEVPVEDIVVKPDGLTGGKGVKISGEHLKSEREVERYIHDLLIKTGVALVEEKLQGTEFTVQAFVDGRSVIPMPLVRDYKRAHDNDEGPNTGSMGSYSTENHGLSYVTEKDFNTAKTIMKATVERIRKEAKRGYKGILYGQFMKTSKGIKVVEYNARFGDPEAMNVLSTLETSMDEVCRAIIDGSLGSVRFENKATVCVYVVPEGYPGQEVVRDSPLGIPDDISCELYYASVYEKDSVVHTTGSRSIGVLAKGNTVEDARALAYENAEKISGRIRYRGDIAGNVQE